MYLASMWTMNLFNRCCDICKDFRLEISAINSSDMQSRLVTGSLEVYAIFESLYLSIYSGFIPFIIARHIPEKIKIKPIR